MTTTILLTKTANHITVTANGETIATDAHLAAAKIHRATGYTTTDAGMIAAGADLR